MLTAGVSTLAHQSGKEPVASCEAVLHALEVGSVLGRHETTRLSACGSKRVLGLDLGQVKQLRASRRRSAVTCGVDAVSDILSSEIPTKDSRPRKTYP